VSGYLISFFLFLFPVDRSPLNQVQESYFLRKRIGQRYFDYFLLFFLIAGRKIQVQELNLIAFE
jgi:hypothetical protein